MTAYDLLFKVLLLGDSNVGKSCIIVRYAEDRFDSAALCKSKATRLTMSYVRLYSTLFNKQRYICCVLY